MLCNEKHCFIPVRLFCRGWALNIQFRKSDYAGLAVISTLLGLGAACWFATGLLGITLVDMAAVWENIKVVMVEAMSHTPPDWPMVIT
ncbi:MAG: YjcB family protein [Enterobacter sp.]|nr:YjcB family protein [Enterobacter sp.]